MRIYIYIKALSLPFRKQVHHEHNRYRSCDARVFAFDIPPFAIGVFPQSLENRLANAICGYRDAAGIDGPRGRVCKRTVFGVAADKSAARSARPGHERSDVLRSGTGPNFICDFGFRGSVELERIVRRRGNLAGDNFRLGIERKSSERT